jgi:apolipoprotein N-acyltransferase
MKRALLLAVLSGVLLAASFAPTGLWPLAFVAVAPFIYALFQPPPRRAFVIGLVFGMAYFVSTVYWVVNAMYIFGGVPFATGAGVMLLLSFYLALYPALFALGAAIFRASRLPMIAVLFLLPSLWIGLEYLRTVLFTGFPWVLVGYTQANFLPFVQIADLFGVWGVGFVVMCVNSAIALFISNFRRDGKAAVATILLGLGLLTSAGLYGFIKMPDVRADVEDWKKLRVAVAQGSVDQAMKWDPEALLGTIDRYRELTLEAVKHGAELIVWPETAMPFYVTRDANLGPIVRAIARESKRHIVTGSPHYEPVDSGSDAGGEGIRHYNSAFVISPDGAVVDRYDKHHLVPFGEYVPLKRLLFFAKKLTAGVGDFSPGEGASPIEINGVRAGMLICFESIFPEIAAEFMRGGAAFIINITNDAWFGRTSAPYQHFDMSVLRAVESRAFVVRSANTGISGVIDPTGRVLAKTALFDRDVVLADIGLKEGTRTFFDGTGRYFPIAVLCVSILALGFAVLTTKRGTG